MMSEAGMGKAAVVNEMPVTWAIKPQLETRQALSSSDQWRIHRRWGHFMSSIAASVTAQTVGLSTYGDMAKPRSTYGRSVNLAETTLAETKTEPKVI